MCTKIQHAISFLPLENGPTYCRPLVPLIRYHQKYMLEYMSLHIIGVLEITYVIKIFFH